MPSGVGLSVEDFDLLDGTKENAQQINSKFKEINAELEEALENHPELQDFVWTGVDGKTPSPYVSRAYIQSGHWRDHMWLGLAHRYYRETVEKPQNSLQLQFMVHSEDTDILPTAGWWLHLDESAPASVRNEIRTNLDQDKDRFFETIEELSEHRIRVGSELWDRNRIEKNWESFLDNLDAHLSIFIPASPEEIDELGNQIIGRTIEEFDRLLPLYGLLSGTTISVQQQSPSIWIEQTAVAGREYKREGELALGKAIWSPQRATDGHDRYRMMREVEPDDIIIHYVKDNGEFVGISTVDSELIDDFICPPESEWGSEDEDRPAYRYNLRDYTEFESPIDADSILDNEDYVDTLEKIKEQHSHLFYIRYQDGFRPAQGSYLSRSPTGFVELLCEQSEELPTELEDRGYTQAEGINRSLFSSNAPEQLARGILTEIVETELRPELYRRALAHLFTGKNIVFYGPPGTGKTRAARLLSRNACAGEVPLETANAEWTNYEVVGGPRLQSDGSWEDEPGFFTRAADDCAKALASTGRPRWLIIDELNRANLDEAFGEVFTLLDLDYRSDSPLPIEEIRVPLSFRVLATMNTYDKAQLFALGYAFMRRFAFVEVPSLLERSDRPSPTRNPEASINIDDLDLRPEMQDVKEIVGRSIVSHFNGDAHEQYYERDSPLGFPEVDDEIDAGEHLSDLLANPDLQIRGYDFIDALLLFAQEITDRDVVEIGQALIIDSAKYVVAHAMLFPDEVGPELVDQAVVAYVLPQFDYYMPQLRKAETMGGDRGTKDRLNEIIAIAAGLGFEETTAILQNAKEDMRIIG